MQQERNYKCGRQTLQTFHIRRHRRRVCSSQHCIQKQITYFLQDLHFSLAGTLWSLSVSGSPGDFLARSPFTTHTNIHFGSVAIPLHVSHMATQFMYSFFAFFLLQKSGAPNAHQPNPMIVNRAVFCDFLIFIEQPVLPQISCWLPASSLRSGCIYMLAISGIFMRYTQHTASVHKHHGSDLNHSGSIRLNPIDDEFNAQSHSHTNAEMFGLATVSLASHGHAAMWISTRLNTFISSKTEETNRKEYILESSADAYVYSIPFQAVMCVVRLTFGCWMFSFERKHHVPIERLSLLLHNRHSVFQE